MNRITVERIEISANRIEVIYKAEGKIRKQFNPEVSSFWCEYSVPVGKVPAGIAVIPFVCNVLPLVWLTDAELLVPELDHEFYMSVPAFKLRFVEMYPHVKFAGKMTVGRFIERHVHEDRKERNALFFSGGVDAMASLLAHRDEKPDLVTVWGADVRLHDYAGWENVRKHVRKIADGFGCKSIEIKSNLRTFINPRTPELSYDWGGYWAGIQFGIGIISLEAPLAFSLGHSVAYFASSYSPEYRRKHPSASDPRIDERIRFCGIRVIHDQAEYNRQEKVDHIVKYVSEQNTELPLRVCWIAGGGKNCCRCEKCYRTIMGLLASGADLKRYGFQITRSQLTDIEPFLKRKLWFAGDVCFWKEIQDKFIEMKGRVRVLEGTDWIYTFDFDKVNIRFNQVKLLLKIRIGSIKQGIKKFLIRIHL